MSLEKFPSLVVPAIRAMARGMPCMYRIPGVCNHNPETTVWCHSDALEDNKAKGTKSDDDLGAFGCSACHEYTMSTKLDRDEKFRLQRLANRRTMRFCWDEGLFRVDEKMCKRVRHG